MDEGGADWGLSGISTGEGCVWDKVLPPAAQSQLSTPQLAEPPLSSRHSFTKCWVFVPLCCDPDPQSCVQPTLECQAPPLETRQGRPVSQLWLNLHAWLCQEETSRAWTDCGYRGDFCAGSDRCCLFCSLSPHDVSLYLTWEGVCAVLSMAWTQPQDLLLRGPLLTAAPATCTVQRCRSLEANVGLKSLKSLEHILIFSRSGCLPGDWVVRLRCS